jgi:hypothetical protein
VLDAKNIRAGEALAAVELGGVVGAVQVSDNVGLVVIPRFDTKPDPLNMDPDADPFFAYYTLP